MSHQELLEKLRVRFYFFMCSVRYHFHVCLLQGLEITLSPISVGSTAQNVNCFLFYIFFCSFDHYVIFTGSQARGASPTVILDDDDRKEDESYSEVSENDPKSTSDVNSDSDEELKRIHQDPNLYRPRNICAHRYSNKFKAYLYEVSFIHIFEYKMILINSDCFLTFVFKTEYLEKLKIKKCWSPENDFHINGKWNVLLVRYKKLHELTMVRVKIILNIDNVYVSNK